MKRFLIIISIVISLLSSLEAKKYALIVGMPSGFKSPVDEGIRIDTSNMNKLLKSYGFKVTKLSDPSGRDFIKKMRTFQNLTSKDTFIFYYSGHGAQTEDLNGDEEDGKDEAIILKAPQRGIVDDLMYQLLSKIKAKKYVFFDSCHSGTAFQLQDSNQDYQFKTLGFISGLGDSNINSFAEKAQNQSLVFMGAAADGTSAMGTNQGGFFTNALMDGLKRKKADLNKNGKITFDELLKFTRSQIKENVSKRFGKKYVYTPQLSNSVSKKQLDILSVLSGNTITQSTQNSSSNNTQTNTTSANNTIVSEVSNLEKKLDKIVRIKKTETIDIQYKKTYFEGDSLTFSVDAYGQNGYLYLIYSDLQKHTLLYPNSNFPKDRISNGILNFPRDISRELKFSVKKPHGRAAVFAILSPVPLNLYRKKDSNIFDTFNRDSSKTKYLVRELVNMDTTLDKLSIGKAVFTVSEGI